MSATTQRVQAWVLVAMFGAIVGGVPAVQVWREWRRGERIQAVDLYRYAPTAGNLRRFEQGLEERSWLAGVTRPMMREGMYVLWGEPGPKALMGEEGWLFYRPGMRYLVEPGAGGPWMRRASMPRREQVLRLMQGFRDDLRARGIELLVVPVPVKASVYPDRLSGRYRGRIWREGKWVERWTELRSPTEGFMAELRAGGLEVVDLFGRFREARDLGAALYLAQDTHWTPRGAELAASAVGARLLELGWVEAGTNGYTLRPVRVKRRGDIIEMTQVAGLRRHYPGEDVVAHQVIDPELGLQVPTRSDRPGTYRDPGGRSQVLVLGDSFSRIYQYAEPQSLGERLEGQGERLPREPDPVVAARLYPGSAGWVSHLTKVLAGPVDAVVSDGGATTDVRRRLSVNPEILEGKRVVIWEFVERDTEQGEWAEVPLPRRLGEGL